VGKGRDFTNFDYLGIDLSVKQRRAYNETMHMPERIPGLKLATLLVAVYAVVWIALEGNLSRVVLLALGMTLVLLGHGSRRLWGRRLSRRDWLFFSGLLGLALGAGSGVLALILMAVKTGLHAHGPEFTAAEIGWVVAQLPWWLAGGALAGVGAGLIGLAVKEGSAVD
jgi:hypothetical protein